MLESRVCENTRHQSVYLVFRLKGSEIKGSLERNYHRFIKGCLQTDFSFLDRNWVSTHLTIDIDIKINI